MIIQMLRLKQKIGLALRKVLYLVIALGSAVIKMVITLWQTQLQLLAMKFALLAIVPMVVGNLK